ncbi:hypothetical protein [Microbacterium sp. TPD7012]|uniref:hypothetical protein n=1 Tax=Microbacterium sp. TPD7012 TaxID=2171975 RepID=UPI000D50BB24|nr:hypothetical protein [Microbacterium sp. TPD7012]PVE94222.1 hypothetical protein DC434_15895 [Microbacterium sp. TPD7012]
MGSAALVRDLSEMFGLLAHVGVIAAFASAGFAAIAFALSSASSGGLATAGWLVAVMLSLCGCFFGNWILPAVAISALPLVLLVTGVTRMLHITMTRRPGAVHPLPPRHQDHGLVLVLGREVSV